MSDVPKSHPRYLSLITRDKIVNGVEKGITSMHGLLAHGRGEAFDYLVGERTNDFAFTAIEAAAAMLLTAKHPMISVNGNVAALSGEEMVSLAKAIGCKIEVNIFHASEKREKAIISCLNKFGKSYVLQYMLKKKKIIIPTIDSNRRYMDPEGIAKADVVIVPLEDGDRCKGLVKMGKKVITIDLNPMSRTAVTADVTIVDNIIRAMPLLIKEVKLLGKRGKRELQAILSRYNNASILKRAKNEIKKNLDK